jgi:hypothetical protein
VVHPASGMHHLGETLKNSALPILNREKSMA